jgi:hypothetical protein
MDRTDVAGEPLQKGREVGDPDGVPATITMPAQPQVTLPASWPTIAWILVRARHHGSGPRLREARRRSCA